MNMMKSALASAVALTLVGGNVWAACPAPAAARTTTCEGQFIFDRTTVSAGDVINIALLGLTADGVVDRFGEQQGAILFVTISSSKGQVVGGSATPGETPNTAIAGGEFAVKYNTANASMSSDVRSLKLSQGLGRTHVYYPPNATGQDTITIELKARTQNTQGGVDFTTIATQTRTITITPPSTNPEALDITGFAASANDKNGMSDMDIMNGIDGQMTAGVAGGQVTVTARKAVSGTATLNLRSSGATTPAYTFTQAMVGGKAVFSLPSAVNKSGKYYIEATFADFAGNSIDLISDDTLTVVATGVPRGLSLSGDKQRVRFATGVLDPVTVKVQLLDEFGNSTSNAAGTATSVSLKDANSVITSTITVSVPSAGSMSEMIGDATGEITKLGAMSISGTAVDAQNAAIATITKSNDLAVTAVQNGLTVTPLFTTTQAAGTEFDAFNVLSTQTGTSGVGDTAPGVIQVTNTSSKEVIEVTRNDTTGIIRGLFKKATTGTQYLISDKAGVLAQAVVTAGAITNAPASTAKYINAHGLDVTALPVARSGEDYIASVPAKPVSLLDGFGNAVTGMNLGTTTITTANGSVTYTAAVSDRMVPGSMESSAVKYLTSGATKFSGTDTLTFNFTAPGVTPGVLKLTTVVPELQKLSGVQTLIENDKLPLNAEVAMTVQTVDQAGKAFETNDTVSVTFNAAGADTLKSPNVSLLGGTTLVQGSNLTDLSSNLGISQGSREILVIKAGQEEGNFSVRLADANNTASISALRTFTVQKAFAKAECGPSNLTACTTQDACVKAGGTFTNNVCAAPTLPTIEGSSSAGTGTTTAQFAGGISVAAGPFKISEAAKLTQDVVVRGEIKPETADVGKKADIVVAGIHTSSIYAAGSQWYQLDGSNTNVVVLPATSNGLPDLAQLKFLTSNVTLTNPYLVDLYRGKFVYAGPLQVYFGYQITEGTPPQARVVFGKTPIAVNITE